MEKLKYTNNLTELFKKTYSINPSSIEDLKADGSNRKLLRIKFKDKSVIGVFGPDKAENNAFVYFSNHFKKYSLSIPEIYAYDENNKVYIETDLGNQTLFDFLIENRKDSFPEEAVKLYKKALEELSSFQTKTILDFDLKKCYPRSFFDRQSIMWDLNYFKYYFVKLANIPFDEQKLENDFNELTEFLLKAKSDFFLYRDFQSRNIMVKDNKLFFIDYQGGRKGALQYDVASLLYDAKADIPQEIRLELLDFYLSLPEILKNTTKEEFLKYYYAFVYIRLMQAMGAYGLRGFYEKKIHFLQSVPYVIKNLEWLLSNVNLDIKLPELNKVFKKIVYSSYLRQFSVKRLNLTLKINSFSYKKGIPPDFSGHNGGFVFDCRCLPNPGREEKYKNLTGKDKEVKEYLSKYQEVNDFFENSKNLIDIAVKNYFERNFTDLFISFGCTGGQHRSVYFAERMVEYFKNKKDISIELKHTEIGKK